MITLIRMADGFPAHQGLLEAYERIARREAQRAAANEASKIASVILRALQVLCGRRFRPVEDEGTIKRAIQLYLSWVSEAKSMWLNPVLCQSMAPTSRRVRGCRASGGFFGAEKVNGRNAP